MKQQIQTNKIEWQVFELKEVIECVENGNRPKGGVGSLKEGIPSIGGEHINKNGGFDFSNIKFISKEFFDSQKRGIIKQGDVLVVKDGATTGRVTLVSEDKFPYNPALVNEHVFILRPKSSMISSKFLFYYLYSGSGQKRILDNFHGSAQGGINTQFVKNVKIPIPFIDGKPDLKEQERIVKILEKAENLKERGKNANDLLDEYLKSVFNEMFYNKGFEEVELGDEKICLISGEYGSGASAKDFDGKVRYIRITDIDEDGNLRGEKVSPNKIEQKYFLQKGDLLFARSGATVGKTYLHNKEENFQYAGYLIRFRFNNKIIPKYTYFFTKTPKYLNWISLVQRVVAQPNINAKQYSSLKIPLPPLPLQQKFAKIVEQVEKMKENVKKTKGNSEELFNSLISKAFRGEL